MKFQRPKCPKLVRIEYNRIFLFQTGKFQYPSFTQNVIKSSLFAVGHLQKGQMVLETSLLSQLNNTKQSREICLTCFFSSFSLSESCRSSVLISSFKTCYCCLYIYTHLLPLVMDHTHDNWHCAVTCRKDVVLRNYERQTLIGCHVKCNFLVDVYSYVFLSRGEKNRPYTFKKFNRELRFKGFQELRIHHLAIGINESYCSLKNTLYI